MTLFKDFKSIYFQHPPDENGRFLEARVTVDRLRCIGGKVFFTHFSPPYNIIAF